jgi:hypothetical protein
VVADLLEQDEATRPPDPQSQLGFETHHLPSFSQRRGQCMEHLSTAPSKTIHEVVHNDPFELSQAHRQNSEASMIFKLKLPKLIFQALPVSKTTRNSFRIGLQG